HPKRNSLSGQCPKHILRFSANRFLHEDSALVFQAASVLPATLHTPFAFRPEEHAASYGRRPWCPWQEGRSLQIKRGGETSVSFSVFVFRRMHHTAAYRLNQ